MPLGAVMIMSAVPYSEIQIETLRRPGLKVTWLAYFIEAGRKGQIAAAAQALGISGQALRRNLDQLEEHLSLQLIQYHGKLLQLTPNGEAFLGEACELFNAIRNLTTAKKAPLPVRSPRLRLGWTKCWLQNLLVSLCSQVRESFPEHRLSIHHYLGPNDLEQALLSGQLDLALSWAPPASEKIASVRAQPSPYLIVSAPQPARPWENWSYAIPDAHLASLHPWERSRYPQKVQMEVNSFYALLDIAISGLCAVYLPECLIRRQLDQGQLAVVAEAPMAHYLTAYLCWQPKKAHPELQMLVPVLAQAGFS